MTQVAMIRHGPTAWNRRKRIQGWTDVPLDAEGRAWVTTWRLPADFAGWPVLASPLIRARETAEILLGRPVDTDPRLKEIGYGEWEGETLADLRDRLGTAMLENEARGWHFQAPDGESPARVFARVKTVLADIAASGRPHVLVCHRTVIRTVQATAAGWDMLGKPPGTLLDGCAHLFRLDPDGHPTLARLNIPLSETTALENDG